MSEPRTEPTGTTASNRVRGPTLRRVVAPYLHGQRHRLALLSVVAVLGALAEAAVLVLLARVALALTSATKTVDIDIGPLDDSVSIPTLIGVAAGLVVVRVAFQFAQAHFAARTASGVMHNTRRALIRSYLRASWALQSAERDGRLQELLTTYALAGTTGVLQLSQVIVSGLSLLAFIVAAFVVDVVAALVVAGAAVLLALLFHPLRNLTRRLSSRSRDATLAFGTAITEFASTAQEVRVFSVEPEVRARLESLSANHSARYYRTRFNAQMIPGIYQGSALLAMVVALGIVYAIGTSELASLGAVVLIALRSMAYGQVLQTSLHAMQEGAPYLEALTEEQLRYQAAAVPRDGLPVPSIGKVRFDAIGFAYEPGVPVLRDVSFAVSRGEIIGIVGPSGAGKSTMVQLLLRLREPTTGRVLVDGRDVTELSLDDWYRNLAFVPQEHRLFAGTIEDNIRFFREDVSRATIESAARRAHLHDDILAFPRGYDTEVGERGGELSGGQAQRLCIARALVTSPDLLVLDEPTSALDARSEALMRDTIAELAPHTTVFVIAHRLSTLTVCDRIMVFDQGRLQGFDAPEQLKAGDPFYREALRLSGMR